MKKNFKNQGITLIALVITIIVLLILAGVSIAMLIGENGILTQAQNAKKSTETAAVQEQRDLAKLEAQVNQKTTDYTDNSNENTVTVPIPAGFAVSGIEGENTVKDGLVITDSKGNEFVWIPCTKEEYENATDQKGSWNQWEYSNKTWNDITVPDTISYEDRLKSVDTYGGFYVARYEAGIPENATAIYANSNGATYVRDGRNVNTYTPVSQKGMPVWNWISQTNSKKAAQNMVSNSTVQSYLIDSYAWDIICKKINSIYGENRNIRNSTTWGNYYNNTTTKYESLNTLFAVHTYTDKWNYAEKYQKGSVTGAPKNQGNNRLELATGASEDFKAYNIYDLAGNVWEWTTEQSDSGYAVLRGGSFNSNGSSSPVVCRGGDNTVGGYNFHIGFRAVLYLK